MLASVRRVGRTNKEQVKVENHLLQKNIENKGPWWLTTLICESKQVKQSPLCQSLGRRLDRAAVEQLSLLSGWNGHRRHLWKTLRRERCVPSDAASVTKQPHT